jgi:hypothetical protein
VCGVGAVRRVSLTAPFSSYRFSNSRQRSRFAACSKACWKFVEGSPARDSAPLGHRAITRPSMTGDNGVACIFGE